MLANLQSIDRRYIYLLLFFSIAVSLYKKSKLPAVPSSQVRDAFAAIEQAPADKIALIGAEWSASTTGENRPQTYAIMHHLMRRKVKMAVIGFDPQGPENVEAVIKDLSKQYGYVYGRDWVNFGFRPYNACNATLKAMVRDIAGGAGHDIKGTVATDTEKLPIMKKCRDMNDVGIIIEISPSDTYERWVAFVQGYRTDSNPKGTPMVFSPTSVMAPEAYQYLDSGQMVGMITGLKGAIEYEYLVGHQDQATGRALALGVTHILVIVLIVVGNIGYLMHRRRTAAEAEA